MALGKLIASFVHQDGVSAAAFSPDGARILTGSADNTAKLWDVASVNLIASFAHQGTVKAVAFSPDGARILTGSADKPPSSGIRPLASSSPPSPIWMRSTPRCLVPMVLES